MSALQADPTAVAGIAPYLQALTQPNTEAIRQAEAALKQILKDARCVPVLVEIIKSNGPQDEATRHVATVLLRKKLPGHYDKLDPAAKAQLKVELLAMMAQKPPRTVLNGLIGVTAAVGKLESSPGNTTWPELFQFITENIDRPTPEEPEMAFGLLEELTETIAISLKEQFGHFATLFMKGMVPTAHTKVQKAALKAIGQLLTYLIDEPQIDAFAGLIPHILEAAGRNAQDEDLMAIVLDVLYDLSYSPSQSVTVHMQAIVKFSLTCIQEKNLDVGVRDSAALVIATMAEARPKSFGKEAAMVAEILETLFVLIENSPDSAAGALFESNPNWREDLDGDDDFDDLDSPTDTSMAQGTLDMLACELPKKYIFEPVVSRCLQRLSSPQPNHRKAGVASLGVIAEGCAEPIAEHLTELMPHVLKCAQDPDSQVRECACFCLGQIAEHCQPTVLDYSTEILPIVFNLLDDQTVAVQATSCYVLEMFCERLEPDAVRPLLDPLVKKLAGMLETTDKRSVQEMAVAALAATAVAAEEEFTPYIGGVANLMVKLMGLTEERMFSLRGRALECMGHMAIAVGRETFRPYYQMTMQCAHECIKSESTELHEFAYAVFANLSKVMKEEFAPALPLLVPHLLVVIADDEGSVVEAENSGGQFGAFDDSDDEEDGNYVLQVRTGMLEAKKGALTAIGEMAAHTGGEFAAYLEQVMPALQQAAGNWHPAIKTEVADALPSMVVPSVAQYHGGKIEWTKGDTTACMSQHTTAITAAVLKELIALTNDMDSNTVGKACEGIQSIIELCGPSALQPVANECFTAAHAILSKKLPCQTSDEFLGEPIDDDDDHDVVTQAACDLVGGFCRVMGAQFGQFLPQFLPAVCEYAKSSRPARDRSMAIGWLSEVAQELEAAIVDHWHSYFLPATLAGLGDPSEEVRRNAAFCAGICCEVLKERVVADYPQILQGLEPLFGMDGSAGEAASACVDNAAACVARMIMASPTSVPMPQVLPAMLRLLPLKTDMTENETVYKCLLGLIQMGQPDAVAQKAELQRVFTQATAADSKVDEEVQAQLKQAAHFFQ
mmetsp:Transcript_17104/g.39311  ORF Transcript_17104/g.39311 Transcript_17104/m.39311 type:complete len:1066 (+) Transcript_17104:110-3307(+)